MKAKNNTTPSITVMPEKFKSRLYPVVLNLFSENDFHQVNIREISRLSGLSTSTIYKYFPSKEELLFAILDEKVDEIYELVKMHIKGLESVREIFRKSFWVLMDYYDRNPGVAITFFITVPTRTWMQKESYQRSTAYDIISEVVKIGIEKKEIDPIFTNSWITRVFFMHCYDEVHRWYYNGMKWKLVDAIPEFFPVFWKTVSLPKR